jgi:Tol biopolymer transport system component
VGSSPANGAGYPGCLIKYNDDGKVPVINIIWEAPKSIWLKASWSNMRLRLMVITVCSLLLLLITACETSQPQFVSQQPVSLNLIADGESHTLSSEANNVRELLAEAGVNLADSDLVDPPLFTPLTDGMEISVVRVTESIEIIEQSIPFQRRSVRNESMDADSAPVIVQNGRTGLQEITVRIVYHDGLELSRQQTKLTVLESALDEIVMIGVGSAPGDVDFPGQLAFINGGNSIILRGSSAFAEQLDTGSDLDHRVFSLSPSGQHLLYTRISTDTGKFNSLWAINTVPNATPKSLGIDNVLWADWNPDRNDKPQIAYTTGIPTELLPGWEANNDLWIGNLPSSSNGKFRPERLVEAYPATYGWWGGNYVWSPTGRYIAYSHADEVGIIDTEAEEDQDGRTSLHAFSEYNTRADWVWVPSLTWSPDGKFLAFTRHASQDPVVADFDTWIINVENGNANRFAEGSGIWGHPSWSPFVESPLESEQELSQIAFLRASNPVESQRSTYTLWLMDRDGSNAQQLYPAAGENSRFPREQSFMTWGPTGHEIAFVYDNDLYLYDLKERQASQITHDDNIISNPTWAPYGRAASELLEQPEKDIIPTPEFAPKLDVPLE